MKKLLLSLACLGFVSSSVLAGSCPSGGGCGSGGDKPKDGEKGKDNTKQSLVFRF